MTPRDHADRRLGLFAPKLMMARRLAVSTTKFQIVFGNWTTFLSLTEFNFDVAELIFINRKYGGIIQWRNQNVYRSCSPISFLFPTTSKHLLARMKIPSKLKNELNLPVALKIETIKSNKKNLYFL